MSKIFDKLPFGYSSGKSHLPIKTKNRRHSIIITKLKNRMPEILFPISFNKGVLVKVSEYGAVKTVGYYFITDGVGMHHIAF